MVVVVGDRVAGSTETELANHIHISTIYTSADCIARKRAKPDGRKSRNPYKVNSDRSMVYKVYAVGAHFKTVFNWSKSNWRVMKHPRNALDCFVYQRQSLKRKMLTWKSLDIWEYKTIRNGFNLKIWRYLYRMTLLFGMNFVNCLIFTINITHTIQVISYILCMRYNTLIFLLN